VIGNVPRLPLCQQQNSCKFFDTVILLSILLYPMRPPATDQNYARNPLNELLGTPANVRLIRVLADEVAGPIGAPEAAERAGLTEAGARRALKRLARTGFVERLGGRRSQTFRLRESDPLAEQIIVLFCTEHDRYQALIRRLHEVFGELPEVRAAWLDEAPPGVGQPLHIGVLADSSSLAYLAQELRRRVVAIEHDYDLTIEIHTFSRADVPEVDWAGTTLLGGHPVSKVDSPVRPRGHSERVSRARKMSEGIAALLDEDPSIVRRAQRHLGLLLDQDQGPASHDLREWKEILDHYSRERLREFLVADTPRAQRLRQSSPFFAVLTAEERDEIMDRVARNDP
jgi:DNA-binding Lrp family transcriptional regulator